MAASLEQVTSRSPSPSPPIANATEQPSRSFIHLGSPRAQNTSFPVTPITAPATSIMDPPGASSFVDYLRTWSDAHVAKWLAEIKCASHIDTFKEHDIRGDVLLELDQDTLKEMKITTVGDKLRILNGVKSLRQKCQSRTSSPPSPRDPPRVNGLHPSHSRENSRDSLHRENSSISKAPKRLENKPAPLVLSTQGRGDLPRVIREPPFRRLGTFTSTRPLLPPLPPAPRGQPPQPPTGQQATLRYSPTTRTLHPLSGPRSRTANQDLSPYTNSPLPPAPASQGMLTPSSGSSSWTSYGLPSDPRPNTLKPPTPSLLPSPRTSNSVSHGRNISFGGVSSPLGYAPLPSKQRPSTSGTTNTGTHPYASAQPPTVQPAPGPNNSALSPIAESHQSGTSSPGSTSPPAGNFAIGRSPLGHPSHSHTPSLDERHKLVKFILPEEGRSYVIDVVDCTGGIDVMEKVLRKPNVSGRKDDPTTLTNRVETDDGGLCIDGWSVYIEWDDQRDPNKPLSETELLAVCHNGPPDSLKDHGLSLRRTSKSKRSKGGTRAFDEPSNMSPTSPVPLSRPSTSDDEHDIMDVQSFAYPPASTPQTGTRSKAIKRASAASILSGLGVRNPERALEPPTSPTQATPSFKTALSGKKPSKLLNFFGQRPPSELITTHLTEYFPFAEKKALRTARHSMMLRASTVGGKRDSVMSLIPPLPSRFSISTQGSGSGNRSTSPTRTVSSKRTSTISVASGIPDPTTNRSNDALSVSEEPPRVSVSTEDGRSVILTGDDVEKLSASDSKPHLLPPVNFPTESLSESMESLTGSKRLSRASSNISNQMSYMTELRSKRDRSDTASLLTVDEITAEVENRRQSMAIDMGVEGAEDWTKVEPDIDDVSDLSDGVFDEDEDEDEDEEEDEREEEPGKTMTCSNGGTKWIKGALIGAGSFGKVYLGMDAVNGLLMAVKQVELPTGSAPNEERKKSMLNALEREIDLLKDLQHPNIVQYLYSSVDDDFLNIFLEYVPGGSVTALLRNYGAFEEPLVKNFVRQILQGLNYLHERDIIHRDIKGANILVDNKGGIKISDFGISKKVDGNLLTGKRMYRPSFQGSVFWMAPEVVQQKVHTTAADIWSVGCLVVEMLTGEHPWAQLTQTQAIFKIGQSAKPEIPSDISPEAKEFLKKAFEINHTARPSAGELLQYCWLAITKPVHSSNKNAGGSKNVPVIEVSA
ncbi:Pkinase-domain-containing protein [Scleroderma citrinum]